MSDALLKIFLRHMQEEKQFPNLLLSGHLTNFLKPFHTLKGVKRECV